MDEKDLQNARQAYSMLCASLDDIGYHYQQNDEDLDVHFEVHGDGLPMELTISIDGERDLIRLLSFLPFKVKPERSRRSPWASAKSTTSSSTATSIWGLKRAA